MVRKFISILILICLITSFTSSVCFADDDRSYSIWNANIDLFPEENGKLHVNESFLYSFSGTYNGVYRDIPIKEGERIENINVTTEGAYSRFTVTQKGDMQSIKVYLYSNPQMTIPITDKNVRVNIEYDFINVITIYNDIAELHYKIWGEGWEVKVGELNTRIHLKSENGVKYWINPPYLVQNAFWQGSVLNIRSINLEPGQWEEVRLAIPKDQFNNPVYAKTINEDGLAKMEQIQKNYENELFIKNILYNILALLMLLSIIIPFIIYFKYGREPKINYDAEYERELPTKDPPAYVNAIAGGLVKSIGQLNMDGFRATIMDLINRKYIKVMDVPVDMEQNENKDEVKLKIIGEYDSKLELYEMDVLNFLKRFSRGNLINLSQMKKDLKKRENALKFKSYYDSWERNLKKDILSNKSLEKFFINKGNKYLKIYGIIALISAIVISYFTFADPLPASKTAFFASIFLALTACLSLLMPQKIAGRWTPYGEEYNAKWMNFKKYLQDYSLIKEYPPESIAIWNQYLVYATALGIADKVRENMELSLPQDSLSGSDIFIFHYYGGYALLSSTLNTGMSAATTSSSGGGGGIGGGSGGGGGGAF